MILRILESNLNLRVDRRYNKKNSNTKYILKKEVAEAQLAYKDIDLYCNVQRYLYTGILSYYFSYQQIKSDLEGKNMTMELILRKDIRKKVITASWLSIILRQAVRYRIKKILNIHLSIKQEHRQELLIMHIYLLLQKQSDKVLLKVIWFGKSPFSQLRKKQKNQNYERCLI